MSATTMTVPTAPSPPATDVLVEVRDLRRRYGGTEVLRGVSFAVRRGELFGLLGTNGAGKTTTVEILQGLRRADSGTVSVLGLDPQSAGDRLRRRVGTQLQDAALPDRMRVGEALRLFASLHPAPQPLHELATEWQLHALWRRAFAGLSGGERQRLFVALALVGRPELVFLDELTQNLDPVGRRHTWDVVRRIRDAGTTVVLVTHDVEEAERLCDRIVVLDRGRVVADGTPAAIVDDLGGTTTVRFTDARWTCGSSARYRACSASRDTAPRWRSRAPARCSPTSAPTSSPPGAHRSTSGPTGPPSKTGSSP